MKKALCLCEIVFFLVAVPCLAAVDVQEGDAFARVDAEHQTWTIGTGTVQMSYEFKDGQLRLVSFQNKLSTPVREYASPSVVFGADSMNVGAFGLDTVWSKSLTTGQKVDPAADNLHLDVKKDDLIGFGVTTCVDDAGALANWVRMQKEYECLFFIADWHALTSDYENPRGIKDNIRNMILDWLSAGLSPEKSTFFVQSHIKEHAELFLILSMLTPVPWLERNPTYKDQIVQLNNKDLSTFGFLGYPVL